jgi:hypothetical protein
MGQKFWPLIDFGMLVRVFESSFGAPQRPSYPPIIHHSSKSDGASSFPMFLGYVGAPKNKWTKHDKAISSPKN